MSQGLYSHTTRGTGTVLTAAIYNGDHQNHIINHNPQMMGGLSDTVSEMQAMTDPGGVGSESLSGNLEGELRRQRFAIDRIVGGAQWYTAPPTDLTSLGSSVDLTALLARAHFATVRTIATGNVAIATALNNADVLNGVTLATGDLVLLPAQTDTFDNGIYVVGAVPARHSQFDAYDEHPGTLVTVQEGTSGADTLYICTSDKGGTLGVTAITFVSLWSLLNVAEIAASDTAPGPIELAIQSEMETATDVVRAVTPGRMHFHPGIAKFWARVSGGSSPTLVTSYNVTSITDTGTGRLTVTIAIDFSSADWCCQVSVDSTGGSNPIESVDSGSMAAGSVIVENRDGSGTLDDPAAWNITGYGDQA